MSVIGMLGHARTVGADLTLFVAVPAVLWVISVIAMSLPASGEGRSFFAAVALGGLGLFIGVYGLIEARRAAVGLAHGEGCLSCIGPSLLTLVGSLWLLAVAVIGFVALFLGRDEVDSAPGSSGAS